MRIAAAIPVVGARGERLVAGRLIAGLPKSVDFSGLSFETAGRRRRAGVRRFRDRRGPLRGGLGRAAIQCRRRIERQAQHPRRPVRGPRSRRGRPAGTRRPSWKFRSIRASRPSAGKRAGASVTKLASRRPVCVRLCDGFFFPVSSFQGSGEIASEEATCAGLCPDAPTALYFLPAGSDKIEDAASTSGERYTALPASLRYRTTRDGACACHRAIAQNPSFWQDLTLRNGDAVMTSGGIRRVSRRAAIRLTRATISRPWPRRRCPAIGARRSWRSRAPAPCGRARRSPGSPRRRGPTPKRAAQTRFASPSRRSRRRISRTRAKPGFSKLLTNA